ncbi:MAG: type II/IV secretion system protein [Phycisphaerales bacterium]|nr:MAG: type II/IV secretion system protein [Phycisphaerales bacterium]
MSRDFAREHLLITQKAAGDQTDLLAVAPSTDRSVVHNVMAFLDRSYLVTVCDTESIATAIDAAYANVSSGDQQFSGDDSGAEVNRRETIDEILAQGDRDLLSTEGKGPIIRLVDALLFEALSRYASDVHIQPLADRTLVRFRLDGVLHTARDLQNAKQLTQAIVSRIKVMGRMDLAERRIPQDGRATVTIGSGEGSRSVDLRISTLPTSYGERAVLRLLDNQAHLCNFTEIGMPPEVAQPYLERAGRANGIILLTGPTGSGKTTTLYSTLRSICSSHENDASQAGQALNVMTIEDPIEYELATAGLAISQAQVNLRKGITFASGLRHILRQDPDVIMIGEIRDTETARVAIQSSLTGHLVFSTLHTNDSASAVTRLMDLDIEPYLVSASLSAVLAQRLVRTRHEACGGAGCETCYGTGFKGRSGLFELLVVDEAMRELISSESALAAIRRAARASGTRTLLEDGARLVRQGRTTEAEVRRVVHGAWEADT